MNDKYIKKLIQLVEESEIESLEVSRWGRKIKIMRKSPMNSNGHSTSAPVVMAPAAYAPAPMAVAPVAPHAPAAPVSGEDTSRYVEIKSPMVGTFYAAPAPDSPPYVSPNERITAGQVVCIVEAMKLMNEIESEVSGRVAKVFIENGKPVEFGQVLFLIDPNG